MGITVKSTGTEGASLEFNFAADLKGVGRFQGTNFRDIGALMGSVRPDGIFTVSGQGFFSTREGETIFYKLFTTSRVE